MLEHANFRRGQQDEFVANVVPMDDASGVYIYLYDEKMEFGTNFSSVDAERFIGMIQNALAEMGPAGVVHQ